MFWGLLLERYFLPAGMRYATLAERELFYQSEFDLDEVARWFDWVEPLGQGRRRVVFAVVIGRHTKIFPERYREDAATTILIDEYKDLEDVRLQVLDFLPESVYYDRNLYDARGRVLGQELAFDIDPENFECPVHGSLDDKMRRGQGLGFCELELDLAKSEALRLFGWLEQWFSRVRVVYSGRGFHIHVFDEEAFGWSRRKRVAFARKLKREGFRVDEWVTSGGMRLIRLPYSLHGMVSRIVLPISVGELSKFNPIMDERCLPKFLKGIGKASKPLSLFLLLDFFGFFFLLAVIVVFFLLSLSHSWKTLVKSCSSFLDR